MSRKNPVSRKKPKKPSQYFVVSAEMRPVQAERAALYFLHAELVGEPDRLKAEDYFLTKMRSIYPEHTVGLMTMVPVTEGQEDDIIDNVRRRRGAAAMPVAPYASQTAYASLTEH